MHMRSRSANGLMSYKDLLHFTPQIRLLYQSVYGRTFDCFQEPTAQRRTVGLVRQHACAKRGPHLCGLGKKHDFHATVSPRSQFMGRSRKCTRLLCVLCLRPAQRVVRQLAHEVLVILLQHKAWAQVALGVDGERIPRGTRGK